jgi:Holliday junction resolvase
MTPEVKFYKWFVKELPQNHHVCRIENSVEQGMPDVNLVAGVSEFWIELKVQQKDGNIYLRKEQFAWGMRRCGNTSARNVLVLVESSDGESIMWWRFPYFTCVTKGKYLVPVERPERVIKKSDFSVFHLVY